MKIFHRWKKTGFTSFYDTISLSISMLGLTKTNYAHIPITGDSSSHQPWWWRHCRSP